MQAIKTGYNVTGQHFVTQNRQVKVYDIEE